MRKDVLLMLVGTFVAILPFLGFPNAWDTFMFLGAGICVIAIGITVRRGKKPPTPPQLFSSHNVPGQS